MPDPKQNLDLWAKLEQLAPEKRGNYRVEVDRISPEYDPVSDTPISGFVKEMPLNEFTRDSLLRLVQPARSVQHSGLPAPPHAHIPWPGL